MGRRADADDRARRDPRSSARRRARRSRRRSRRTGPPRGRRRAGCVFATDAAISVVSSGTSVRGSTTSTLDALRARARCAARSACGTSAPSATTVTSVPSRDDAADAELDRVALLGHGRGLVEEEQLLLEEDHRVVVLGSRPRAGPSRRTGSTASRRRGPGCARRAPRGSASAARRAGRRRRRPSGSRAACSASPPIMNRSFAAWFTIWSKATAGEVRELELDDRSQPGERRADPAADEAALGQRRVADPLGAEALVEPLGRAEEPADPADVLADHDHVGRRPRARGRAPRGSRATKPSVALASREPAARVAPHAGRTRRAARSSALASSSASAASIAASTSRCDLALRTASTRVVVELASSRSSRSRRGSGSFASHSSTSAGSRTSGRFARIECCIRRNVFSSRNVGPSPPRARSSARATASSTASDVVAVDDLARHPVAGGAVGEVLDRPLRAPVGRERELVVLADEDDRQRPRRGEVHPLVRGALPGGAVAEERDRRLVGAAQLRGQRRRRTRAGCPAPTIPLQPRMSSERSAMCIEPPSPLQ